MIKRTVEISTRGLFLSVNQDQLVIRQDDQEIGRVPIEDIGVLILASTAVSYTHAVITRVLSAGAVIVACDDSHLPCGMILPTDNTLIVQRLAVQIAAKKPLAKQLWRQLVRAKIDHQAEMLDEQAPDDAKALRAMAARVRSGDPDNLEGQAARRYWPALLGPKFRRDPEGPPPNGLLNYGYMALRASVARAIAGAGLHPALGLHHHNRSDAFCLADDLMEPLRPLVDRRVRALVAAGARCSTGVPPVEASLPETGKMPVLPTGETPVLPHRARLARATGVAEVNKETRRELLAVLTETVAQGDTTGPLMVALERYVAGLVRCYEGASDRLEIPRPWKSADTDSCGSS